ncbi:MAG: hypothetical protein K2Y22_04395 [Candidatus Obscuribacterales bacterium]|nr:hypothetical protein [Candidatus Obscuribacterales bacterium]
MFIHRIIDRASDIEVTVGCTDLKSSLIQAVKFVIETGPVTELLSTLLNDWSIGKNNEFISYARMPFAQLWIEFPGGCAKRDKQGYLLNALNDQGTAWQTIHFLEMAGEIVCSPLICEFDCESQIFNTSLMRHAHSLDDEFINRRTFLDISKSALVLCLLNCKNLLVPIDVIPSERLNKARQRRGKLPLVSHKLLRLRLDVQNDRSNGSSCSNRDSRRLHLVRGHFKARKSGLYWWSPFVRGSKELGLVTKDYLVGA